jgi:pyruvate dehydrogenase E2 component (dihydrolipoamide acetyltransferase)
LIFQDKRGKNNAANVSRSMCSSNLISGRIFVRSYADDSSDKYPEHHIINLPALSPTMEMGTIVSWEKKEGDQVSEGDLLCEIETDKATMGFETPEEGYLAKVILHAGAKDIPIGRLLCIIVPNEEDVAKFKDYTAVEEETKKADPPKKKAPPSLGLDEGITPKMKPLRQKAAPSMTATPPLSRLTTPPAPPQAAIVTTPLQTFASGDRPFASPAAKKLAAEKGIDLFAIKAGTGMDGMITSKDVEVFVAAAPPVAPTLSGAPLVSAGGALPPMGAPRTTGGMPALMGSGHTDVEITNMRRVIGR